MVIPAAKAFPGKGNAGKGKVVPRPSAVPAKATPAIPAFSAGPEAIEKQFQDRANHLYENLMNGEVPASALDKPWKEVLALRARLLQAYQKQATTPQAPKHAPSAAGDAEAVNFKVALYQVLTTINKRTPTKDEIAFDVQDVEGGGYIASVSSTMLQNQYQSREAMPSKKLAEQAAAQVALEAEHYEAFAMLQGLPMGKGKGKKASPAAVPEQNSKKRKAPENSQENVMFQKLAAHYPPSAMKLLQSLSSNTTPKNAPNAEASSEMNFKQRLTQAQQILRGGGECAKGDIVYECAEDEGGGFVATVTLAAYDPTVGYQGMPAPNKKTAEMNAAEAALVALEEQLGPLEKAKKPRK